MPLGELQPFLVLPGYGKAFDVSCKTQSSGTSSEFAFAASRDVYIIGLGLAQDDHFIRSFFLYCFPFGDQEHSVFVINPDPNISRNYAFELRSAECDIDGRAFLQQVTLSCLGNGEEPSPLHMAVTARIEYAPHRGA